MVHRSPFRVVPPRRKAPLTAKRSTPKPLKREVEHVVYGVGTLLHVRPLDGGMFAAVVNFNGVDRSIRLAPDYFITPIPEIMALAPHLAPPPAPKPVKKKLKASTVPDDDDADDREEDADDDREIDQPDIVAEP
jgi:hypothetical protein